jgi:hypothetical protein
MYRCKERRASLPVLYCLLIFGVTSSRAADRVLVNIDGQFDVAAVEARDAEVSLLDRDGRSALRIATGHKDTWPGVTLKAPSGAWNLATFTHVAFDVANAGPHDVQVSGRVDSPDVEGERAWVQESIRLAPGDKGILRVALKRRLPERLGQKLFGMRGYPGGFDNQKGIDPGQVDRLLVFVGRPAKNHVLEIKSVRAIGSVDPPKWPAMGPDEFFPMIDKYGQFNHKDWPGKTRGDEDLERRIDEERKDLAAHSGPGGWNRYGGWATGPPLKATGHFRVDRYRGKWWLVDPEGSLFWSHGIDCVRSSNGYTPITDREFYFAELPPKDSPFGPFHGKSSWAPHGYYQDKGVYSTFNLTGANLLRKYGPDWKGRFADLCHRRLRSWGLNTIGNWSDPDIYLLRKTPYVATINSGRKPIAGSSGYWGKFPDPFDPDFAETLRRNMDNQEGKAADDPWCVGFFVDNELSWGDEFSLGLATLGSPPEQAAKQAFVHDLKAKYRAVTKLNEAWGTNHASWDAILETTEPPDKEKARDDLTAFYTRIAEQYFRVCREAVKAVAPKTLYLGCRFAWVNDRAVLAAAKYCDVISFNRYRDSVADFTLPEGVDKPAIIGEFHFGALDRGMFHTGLRPVASQEDRANAYRSYVEGALGNRYLVGTHWFQFGDQATTGRGDGENYQIGFLDICDTPYPETVSASRRVGSAMYRIRLEAAAPK